MENVRYEHKKVNLTIAVGQQIAEKRINLPAGTCIGMAAISTGAEPDEFVDLAVLDNGAEVVEGNDFRFYKKTNGGRWIDSLRPMSYDCNRDITIRISAENALAAKLNIQVIIIIIQNF